MKYSPVIIPTLCRFDKFKQCIESLQENKFVELTDLIIGIDFPSSDNQIEGWKKINSYVTQIKGFSSINIIKHKENLGAINNSEWLMQFASENYDSFIFSEDDNVFSSIFLDYTHQMLHLYKNDLSVLAICGYSYPVKWYPGNYNSFKLNRFSAFGFAIWRDRYFSLRNKISHPCEQSLYNKRLNSLRFLIDSRIGFCSAFMLSTRKFQYFNDMAIEAYMLLNKNVCVFPKTSLVRNIGYDGTGENCLPLTDDPDLFSNQYIDIQDSFVESPCTDNYIIKYNRVAARNFLNRHMSFFMYFKMFLYSFFIFVFGYNLFSFFFSKKK